MTRTGRAMAAACYLAMGLLQPSTQVVGVAAAPASPTGTIRGHITISGQIPGNPIIRMGMDPKCADMHRGERVLQAAVVADVDGSLGNVFVALEGSFPQAAPSPVPVEPVVIDQRGCVYQPRVVGLRLGQRLIVRNSDDLLHNVHASSAQGNTFNVGQPRAGMAFEFAPKAPEVMLKIGCDVHSWMTTYVGIVSHQYFAVSDAHGRFEISSVPAGRQRVRLWHERFGEMATSVVVAAGAVATVEAHFSQQASSSTGQGR